MPSTDSLEGRMMMFLRDVFDFTDAKDLATFMTGIAFGMGILVHAPDYASRFAALLENRDDPNLPPAPRRVILALEALVPIPLEPDNEEKD